MSVLKLFAALGSVAALGSALGFAATSGASTISYDERSFILDGQRELLLSGAVHYARVLPEDWAGVFDKMVELGLNTVQTYVMWNFHEHVRGQLDWSDRANFTEFTRLAGQKGLNVVVRIGPYVCGEYYFGGIPLWLRNVDNVSCFRCSDPVWERESARFVGEVVQQLMAAELLYDQGGPVIMLQIENEYNGGDSDYLSWTVAMAQNLTKSISKVPWNLCHDQSKCAAVNAAKGPDQPAVLCTINGFWMDDWTFNPAQPSPIWVSDQNNLNKGQPFMWTEDQGWFDQWGIAKRVRYTSDQIYGIARALAYGLSYHNFYMVTGGSNFGRQSGGEVVTAYAPDTVIDYLLLRHQPRFDAYSSFFHAIQSVSDVLLNASIPAGVPLQPLDRTGFSLGQVAPLSAKTLELSTTTCYQYEDPSQQWSFHSFPGPGSFSNGNDLSQCLDASKPGIAGDVELVKCAKGSTDQQWSFNETSGHVFSANNYSCLSPHAPAGTRCHRCLDLAESGKVDIWDCKGPNDAQADNQIWAWVEPSGSMLKESGTATQNATLRPHRSQGDCLTATPAPSPYPGNQTGLELHEYAINSTRAGSSGGAVAFLSNYMNVGEAPSAVMYRNVSYTLAAHSVIVVHVSANGGQAVVLYNTSSVGNAEQLLVNRSDNMGVLFEGVSLAPSTRINSLGGLSSAAAENWEYFSETPGEGANTTSVPSGTALPEQCAITDNDSDYLWYSFPLPSTTVSKTGGEGSAALNVDVDTVGGTMCFLFADNDFIGSCKNSLDTEAHHFEANVDFQGQYAALREANSIARRSMLELGAEKNYNTLHVLSVAMGMSNSGVGPNSVKGVTSVKVAGRPLSGSVNATVTWMLSGEEWIGDGGARNGAAFERANPINLNWQPVTASAPPADAAITWFRANITTPSVRAEADPSQTAFALNLYGAMNKGTAYVNGFNIGRYFLVNGSGTCDPENNCAPPRHGSACYMHYAHCGEPTQSLYHIPTSVLNPPGVPNEVVLFEETSTVLPHARNLSAVAIVSLHDHPTTFR